MGYTFKDIRNIIIKSNGRPYSLNSKVYTDIVKTWILENIIGNSTINGKLWCIAHHLEYVPTCANVKCNKYTRYHNKFKEGFRKFCGDPSCSANHKETKEKYKKTSLKNWGTENPLENKDFRERCKSIVEAKYGSKYAMQSKVCKEKYKKTSLKNWGAENPLQNNEIRKHCRNTLLKNYGVDVPAKNIHIMKKIMNSRKIRTIAFKNSGIYYQGSYELHFLELMEQHNMLALVSNGLSFKYDYLDKVDRLYVSDFFISNLNEVIEIKSKWTYNRKGSDMVLENQNLAKMATVINEGRNFKFLIGKVKIEEYVISLNVHYAK